MMFFKFSSILILEPKENTTAFSSTAITANTIVRITQKLLLFTNSQQNPKHKFYYFFLLFWKSRHTCAATRQMHNCAMHMPRTSGRGSCMQVDIADAQCCARSASGRSVVEALPRSAPKHKFLTDPQVRVADVRLCVRRILSSSRVD